MDPAVYVISLPGRIQADDGRREGGRWQRGSVDIGSGANSRSREHVPRPPLDPLWELVPISPRWPYCPPSTFAASRWIKDGRLTRTPRGRVSLLAVERLAAGRILDPAARFTGAD